jgi:hypothetical protein
MNLAGQPAKSCTEPSKLGARPQRINAWLKTRTELFSSAHPFLGNFFLRTRDAGRFGRPMFATPQSRPRY